MGRRIIHLRVKSTYTTLIIRTVLLFDPVDEDYLLVNYPHVLNDIKEILVMHVQEILPFAVPATADGAISLSSVLRSDHNPNTPTTTTKATVGAGKYSRVHLTSQEYGYVGDTTICSFSTRPFDFTYPILSLNHIGSTLDIALQTVEHYGDSSSPPRIDVVHHQQQSSSSSSSVATVINNNPLDDGILAETIANIQLFIRILHRERQHQRTSEALTSNPGKLDHYYNSSHSSSSTTATKSHIPYNQHSIPASSSSSSSSSSVTSGTIVNIPNQDIAAIQRFTNQPVAATTKGKKKK